MMKHKLRIADPELAAAKRRAAAAAKHEAATSLRAMREHSSSSGGGEAEGPFGGSGLPLPQPCVELVLSCLAAQGEPYGLVGPSLAARDIANAALACRCVRFLSGGRQGCACI
jgi:hypothetical protein